MADARQPDSALLAHAIGSKSSPLRIEAVRTVGQTGVEGLAPRLRQLLRDRDTAVAATAAFSLGLLHDTESVAALAAVVGSGEPSAMIVSQRQGTTPAGQPTQPANGGSNSGSNSGSNTGSRRPASSSRVGAAPTVVREAAWALGEIGNPARSAIEHVLNAGFAPPDILYAAARLRPVPTAALTTYFWPGNPDVLRAAVYAVTRSREPASVRALLNAAQSVDPITRSYVARGLAKSAAGDSLGQYAFPILATFVTDSVAVVRIEALGSLRGYGAPAQELVMHATHDSVATVRLAAAEALDSTLYGAPDALWDRAFHADTTLAFRAAVAGGALRDGVVLPVLDERSADRWQTNSDWRYRAAAARAVAGLPLERVLTLALPATRDTDGRVRAAAVDVITAGLDSIGPAGPAVRERYLRPWLRDSDMAVRAEWIEALERIGPRVQDVPAIAESYELAIRDSTVDARLAAVEYIATAWENDSDAFKVNARIAVAAMSKPVDQAVVDAARGVSVFSAWHRGNPRTRRPAPHPIEWYERVVREIVKPSMLGHPPTVAVTTERGVLTVELYGADAPLTVENFLSLVRGGYYNGTVFHRVVPGFVAQDGDPRGDGNGGPGYTIRDELGRRRYDRGAVGMALSGPETGGSQYFVTITPQPHLDGRYTTFGHMIRGFDALDHLIPGDRITEISLVAQQ
jgi:cyclophilin family peptidyl-prolyl cis-trans isomerase/HEAT repeat protein